MIQHLDNFTKLYRRDCIVVVYASHVTFAVLLLFTNLIQPKTGVPPQLWQDLLHKDFYVWFYSFLSRWEWNQEIRQEVKSQSDAC